ncbi:MAG: histidine kinase [Bacteroidota bacterium]|nr:histidine kinase [Bacteroidota bacterium]
MQFLKINFKNQLLLLISCWFLICGLVLAASIFQLTANIKLASIDAAISVTLTALPLILVILLQNYLPHFLNKLDVQLFLIAVFIFKVIFLQKIILPFLYSNINFKEIFNKTEILRIFIVFLQAVFSFALMWYFNQLNLKTKQKFLQQQAEITLRDAELIKLRQQLQPHFLFNSLNSINALVSSQPQLARKMIQNLSDFLRGTLKKDENVFVNLSEELKLLELYLEIEKIRFGHRLQVVFNIDEKSKIQKLPALILQPIVENAIKFGLYNVLNDVEISIITQKKETNLIIEIKNPFEDDALQIRKGEGFGLSLVERRLQLMYHRTDLISIAKNNNIFITTLIIPQHD